MFMTYHYTNRASSYFVNRDRYNNGACAVKDYSRDFSGYGRGLAAEPHRLVHRRRRSARSSPTRPAIENGPMQIILNLMVDNDWQRAVGSTLTDETQTRELGVDYLRVYQAGATSEAQREHARP